MLPTFHLDTSMPSLILVVFLIQLAIHLVSTFGGQAINDLVYSYPLPKRRPTTIMLTLP